jgi:3-hydroxybutyryl-CoA dehydrogenase
MRIDELRRVLIVGAGTMGQQISLQCAMHGYDVVLYDQDAAALERARAQHALFLAGFVKAGQLAQAQVGADSIPTRTRPISKLNSSRVM